MIEFVKDRKFSKADFEPYIGRQGNERLAPLPNAENVDPLEFLNTLAAVGHTLQPLWGYTLLPDGSRIQWTQTFLTEDGGGYAVSYGGQRHLAGKSYNTPIVRRFAICKHEVEDHPGANHSRGWHPGHCKKCGMDTTYDSGD